MHDRDAIHSQERNRDRQRSQDVWGHPPTGVPKDLGIARSQPERG
jgi:hypothetical protein